MQRHPITRPDPSSPSPSPSPSNPTHAVPLSLNRPYTPRRVSRPIEEDDDAIADPRPWESAKHPRQYGSLPSTHNYNPLLAAAGEYDEKNLPMFHAGGEENEARRRNVGVNEKEAVRGEGGARGLVEDDQGKWMKGYGAGPGEGGRRGLRPRQRLTGWEGFYVEWEEWIWTGVYTFLSMLTRFWRIGAANYVVWDEAHFGKFGSHYINRDFYFDVHPPLGKMLVGLAGLLSGYNGGFEFKSGVEYPADLPHTSMRVMLASFGVMLVPVAWWTSGEMGWSRFTRHWVTLCVLCGEWRRGRGRVLWRS